ncbi:hypothetical protein [Roseateles sp. L2-2]|uniref:hypothetical protein n=1 Tax=Roseateles sp. L2-2 TaxID=3422597 RepID=UPI003D36C7A5
MAIQFVIGEYRLLREALKLHQSKLQRESEAIEDEDEQLLVDDKLQKLNDMLRGIAIAAKADWDIDLA